MEQSEKNLKILEIIAGVREFEIGLFWRRSLFFWGFSTVAITAYGAAHHYASKEAQFAIACAGLVCSVIWTLVNRSSKYWQKVWEAKAEEASREAVGLNLFEEPAAKPTSWRENLKAFPWWRAHYSVSKLATAFSDFTALVWFGLAFKATPLGIWLTCLVPFVTVCTAIYLTYVFVWCGPDRRRNSIEYD